MRQINGEPKLKKEKKVKVYREKVHRDPRVPQPKTLKVKQ